MAKKKPEQLNSGEEVVAELKEVSQLIASEKFDDAASKLQELRQNYSHVPLVILNIPGQLIDIGSGLGDLSLIDEGITLCEKLLNKQRYMQHKDMLQYNLSNGIHHKVKISYTRSKTYFGLEKETTAGIRKLRKSLDISNKPNVRVNLGNFLDETGRPLEALNDYEIALELDPKFGIAYGNKAMVVENLSRISEYQAAQLIYAYQLYSLAMKYQDSIIAYGGASALEEFRQRQDRIKNYFEQIGQVDKLSVDLKHKRPNRSRMNRQVASYTKFCLDNDLYLNLHILSSHSEASVGDAISTSFTTKLSDDNAEQWVKEMCMRLNEIKEAYISGRYILWLSQQVRPDLSAISQQSLLVNNLDYTAHNIYTGLLKSSYKVGFSVLDKMANTINYYLNLQQDEDKLNYRTVWYENLNKSEGFKKNILTQNHYLFGVFTQMNELGERSSGDRNLLEHKYQRISITGDDPYDAPTFSEYTKQTIEVFYKVKCAIVYLLIFLNTSENVKHQAARRSGEVIPEVSMLTDQWLDLWE